MHLENTSCSITSSDAADQLYQEQHLLTEKKRFLMLMQNAFKVSRLSNINAQIANFFLCILLYYAHLCMLLVFFLLGSTP